MAKQKTYQLTLTAIFIAILLFQTYIPLLGYIPIPPLNITIIHITVIIAAVILPLKNSILVGLAWGVLSFSRAYIAPSSVFDILIFRNFIIAVLPRVLIPIVAGSLFIWLMKRHSIKIAALVAAITGTLTNTFCVLGLIYVIKGAEFAELNQVAPSQLYLILGGIVTTNGIPETIAAAIVVPIVATIYWHKRGGKAQNRTD
ncbi:ECF transporter S component [Bavariicoccus seileri]|uniref:ECF transporter S component n=1 Tax=Bavariicoccus seileri TaxID=549685 RepID=UPI003F905699